MPKRAIAVAALAGVILAGSVAAQEPSPAANATPAASTPTECRVEPRTAEEVGAIVAAATPAPLTESISAEDDLPQGAPADAETAAAVTALEREFAACLNAEDWPRWLALLSEDAIDSFIGPDAVAELFAPAGTPFPNSNGEQAPIETVVVRDVRLLPNGRVGAIVEWIAPGTPELPPSSETNFHVYERDGDRWLIDDEISGF